MPKTSRHSSTLRRYTSPMAAKASGFEKSTYTPPFGDPPPSWMAFAMVRVNVMRSSVE